MKAKWTIFRSLANGTILTIFCDVLLFVFKIEISEESLATVLLIKWSDVCSSDGPGHLLREVNVWLHSFPIYYRKLVGDSVTISFCSVLLGEILKCSRLNGNKLLTYIHVFQILEMGENQEKCSKSGSFNVIHLLFLQCLECEKWSARENMTMNTAVTNRVALFRAMEGKRLHISSSYVIYLSYWLMASNLSLKDNWTWNQKS